MEHLVSNKVNHAIPYPGLSIKPILDLGIGNNGPGLKTLLMSCLELSFIDKKKCWDYW